MKSWTMLLYRPPYVSRSCLLTSLRQHELESTKWLKEDAVAEAEVLRSTLQEATKQLEDASQMVSLVGNDQHLIRENATHKANHRVLLLSWLASCLETECVNRHVVPSLTWRNIEEWWLSNTVGTLAHPVNLNGKDGHLEKPRAAKIYRNAEC